ncbi:fused MFS/spermidine synthase [Planctomyces sp. SH-PL14]|uniref:fused MFS/spermidine synthase n=1 Tax=Planctomyces sp. SH-PL14 TaxID=1632864 RepID=UPI00078EDF22|nr:fused MFS/spermidine synthase [Planctomyces sp. SH-PL14]AMV21178.1 spermidine synthase [Planctomyces sp. SH-PL14]
MQRTCYRLAVFLSAFLLFQLQPLIAKAITPSFGGSAMVWTSCMLFFQIALLGGYLYAHSLAQYTVRTQAVMHWLVLAAALPFLTILPHFQSEAVLSQPLATLVRGLATSVGPTFLLLSATAPLLQRWYAALGERNPYRLYADSNAGSLLGLLTYPLVVEPLLDTPAQAALWAGLASFELALFGLLLVWLWQADPRPDFSLASESDEPSAWIADSGLWIVLSALPCAVLLAVTNKISLEVAPIPLLWIIPLALYLVTFILSFGRRGLGPAWLLPAATAGSLLLAGTLLRLRNPSLAGLCVSLYGVLFFCCLLCHRELARRKPGPARLTQYYLCMSLGGALGTLFVSLGAPLVFTTYLELPLVVAAAVALAIAIRPGPAAVVGSGKTPAPQHEETVPRIVTSLTGFAAIALWLSPDLTGLAQSLPAALHGRTVTPVPELGAFLPLLLLGVGGLLAWSPREGRARQLPMAWWRQALRWLAITGLALGLAGALAAAFVLGVSLFGLRTEVRSEALSLVTSPVLLWGLGALTLVGIGRRREQVPATNPPEPGGSDRLPAADWPALLWTAAGTLLLTRVLVESLVADAPAVWWLASLVIGGPFLVSRDRVAAHGTGLAAGLLAVVSIPAALALASQSVPYGSAISLSLQILMAMICVGLARGRCRRPNDSQGWTTGEVGGAAAALVLGVLFPQLPGPVLFTGCGLAAAWQLGGGELFPARTRLSSLVSAAVVIAVGLSCSLLASPKPEGEVLLARRNFYGTLRVEDRWEPVAVREFIHGSVSHGRQYLEPGRRDEPTMYYHRGSGIGRLLDATSGRPRNIAAVGLGVGTIAAYGQPGDRIRFFEIDPDVEEIARRDFSFLKESRAAVDVVVADGRLALERDRGTYDIVILDAFSGDAIPTHLLTAEALALDLERLRPEGFLALHVSNSHLDLTPIVNDHARRMGLNLTYVDYHEPGPHPRSLWAILSRGRVPVEGTMDSPAVSSRAFAWTDRRHSLLGLLRVRQSK